MTRSADAASAYDRATARPEAEIAGEHGPGDREEESAPTLRKRGSRTASHNDPPRGGSVDAASSDLVELVRATTRFALDLRLLSAATPKGSKRELSTEEKDVRRVLESTSRHATTARNVAMRALVRRDSDALDAWLVTHDGNWPTREELAYQKSYSYPLIRSVCPMLASGMAATLAREVDSKWSRGTQESPPVRYQALVMQSCSPPHYKIGQPFPVRAQDVQWVWSEGRAIATVTLAPGGTPRYRLPIEARDAHQRHVLEQLASGAWRAGEVRIERDRLRPAKWYLRVSYKRRVPLRLEGQAAAVSLGMRVFLVASCADGESWIYDGADIEAHLRRVQSMRRSYRRGVKASARVGRGRPRALKSVEHLAGKSERWRQTRCCVIARRLASWLRQKGVSRVYLCDFTGIRDAPPETLAATKDPARQQWIWERVQEWPYFRLSKALESALQAPLPHEPQEAIEVIPIEQDYHSQRCPECGFISAQNRDLRNWKLRCKACGYRRHLDVAQCANSLARASGEAIPHAGDKGITELREPEGGGKGSARKPTRKGAKSRGSGETSGESKE